MNLEPLLLSHIQGGAPRLPTRTLKGSANIRQTRTGKAHLAWRHLSLTEPDHRPAPTLSAQGEGRPADKPSPWHPRASLVQPALPTAALIPRFNSFCHRLTKLLIFHSRFIHNYITRKLNSVTENYLNQLLNLAGYVNYSSFKSLAAKIH